MIILSRPHVEASVLLSAPGPLHPGAKDLFFFPRGRDALLAGLQAVSVRPGDAIMVPAYICDSTVAPLRSSGYRVMFFDVDRHFGFDIERLRSAVQENGAKAVLAVHYFGFPAPVAQLAEAVRPLGVRVIEDCCHSFLTEVDGRPVGLDGDIAIYSMRKTLPVPDGGALRLNAAAADLSEPGNGGPAPSIHRYLASRCAEAAVAMAGWPNLYSASVDAAKRKLRREPTPAAAATPSVTVAPRPQSPSRLLKGYLSRPAALARIGDRVRENYGELVASIRGAGLRPWLGDLPAGCVPQWAPVHDHTGTLVPWLREHGVGACRWPWHELPAEVAADPLRYPVSNLLNRELALLPVHQGIGRRQLARMHVLIDRWKSAQ